MPGPFIYPQQIFDCALLGPTGSFSPNRIQDSSAIVVAVGPGWTEIFLALLGDSIYWQIAQISAGAGANSVELASGAPGAEIPIFDMQIPPAAATSGWTLFAGPFFLPIGSRISMRTSALQSTIETHMAYNV